MNQMVNEDVTRGYDNSRRLPFRKHVEEYSFFQIAGDISGLRVLDLACGEGFYTRKLKEANVAEILGVDTSSEMIHRAKDTERQNPLGCMYMIHDIATLPYLGPFDMVVAMYLLNYAKTKEELFDLCRSAYRQLETGGRFIGFNDNVLNDPGQYETYHQYGFIKQSTPERREGDPIQYTFFNLDGTVFRYNNYYLHPDTYAAAFAEAGFQDFQWIDPVLDPSQQNNRYWDHFMSNPPVIGFTATKK